MFSTLRYKLNDLYNERAVKQMEFGSRVQK